PQRDLSWSEEQINILQKENRELRQYILDQEKNIVQHQTKIASLQHQNREYLRQIDRQHQMILQFSQTIYVAFQDYEELRAGGWDHKLAKENTDIDEIIHIY
ncbi:hypothetical protein QBC43DRAFT_188498, partial [Cladorrhinum sp. PSN259]